MAAQPCPPDLFSPPSLATLTLHVSQSSLGSQPSPYLSYFYVIPFSLSLPQSFNFYAYGSFSAPTPSTTTPPPAHEHTHARLPMHTQDEVHKSKHQTGSFHRQKRPALTKPIPAFSSHTNSYCKTKHSCLVVSRQFEMLTSLKSSVSSTEITKLQPGNSEEVR